MLNNRNSFNLLFEVIFLEWGGVESYQSICISDVLNVLGLFMSCYNIGFSLLHSQVYQAKSP